MELNELYALYRSCAGGVTTDSRCVRRDSLFVALRGEHFDGNDYALKALSAGASFALVDSREVAQQDKRCLWVPDAYQTLVSLAQKHRKELGIPIIAITGTNGKTTTKELVAAILGSSFNVGFTQGNLNNQIGVPLTLLSFTESMAIGIVEMGASHKGDIAELTAIAEPNYGLITNVGRAHLEGFGSFEGIIATKCELYHWLKEHRGEAFVSVDDPILMEQAKELCRFTYGTQKDADLQGSLEIQVDSYFLTFTFYTKEQSYTVKTQLVGNYNLPNALAAIAIGLRFGVSPERIVQALEAYTPTNSRSQFIASTPHQNSLIVDAYNANPSSMQIAISNFLSAKSSNPKVVILGDMFELGHASLQEHKSLVEILQKHSEVTGYLVGENFSAVAPTVCPTHLHFYPNTEALKEVLQAKPLSHNFILIKASNGMHFEPLVSLC